MSVCAWGLLGGGVGSSENKDGERRECGREWVYTDICRPLGTGRKVLILTGGHGLD